MEIDRDLCESVSPTQCNSTSNSLFVCGCNAQGKKEKEQGTDINDNIIEPTIYMYATETTSVIWWKASEVYLVSSSKEH